MPLSDRPIFLATRGSALALVQTHTVLGQCRTGFPNLQFEPKIIKTTGDKLQTAPPDVPGLPGTKGLFTKELEVALLQGDADLAVHSLKDLPTELPDGLELSAVLPRADVRDVLICRATFELGATERLEIASLPSGATVATSSTRRQAQLLAVRPDLRVVPVRGNVGTRLQKLASGTDLDGLVLAAAGLKRLGIQIGIDGQVTAEGERAGAGSVPEGLRAAFLSVDEMVPCVGQGAIGIEGRINDERLKPVFEHLNDRATWHCVTAERAFLHALGGGCLSPVAAYAHLEGGQLRLQAVSFRHEKVKRTERVAPVERARELGESAAADLR